MTGIRAGLRVAPLVAVLAAGAAFAGACGKSGEAGASDTTDALRVSGQVRATYGRDAVAAGAWTWTSGSVTWVLVDVQSATPGLVQARAELWAGDSAGIARMGQSDVMQSAGEIGAYRFEDLTGDGKPDLLGWVADSAGVSYPIFIPGVSGAMGDELELAAPGWRFAADDVNQPQVFAGPSGPCALQLWAEEPTPDSSATGWRFLALRRDGSLGLPAAAAPSCL